MVCTANEVLGVAAGGDDTVTTAEGPCDEIWVATDVVSTVTALPEVAGGWLDTGRMTWDDTGEVKTPVTISSCHLCDLDLWLYLLSHWSGPWYEG